MMTQEWKDRLLEEKSLWQVFKRSPSLWNKKTNALIVTLSISVCFLITALDSWDFYHQEKSIFKLDETIEILADVGTDFTLTMLGFLLAGFTIFATITKPELFIELANLNKNKKMSQLQFIFFSFIGVFVHYLCFLSLCLIVKIGIEDNGAILRLYSALFTPSQLHTFILSHCGFWALTIWFTIVVVTLKSFVWNLYQIFLLSILTEADRLESEQTRAQ